VLVGGLEIVSLPVGFPFGACTLGSLENSTVAPAESSSTTTVRTTFTLWIAQASDVVYWLERSGSLTS
jgi:hypothetical protein